MAHTDKDSSNVAMPCHWIEGEDDVADVPHCPDGDNTYRRHCPGHGCEYTTTSLSQCPSHTSCRTSCHNIKPQHQHSNANSHEDPPPLTTNGSPPHHTNGTTVHERRQSPTNEDECPLMKTNAHERRRPPVKMTTHKRRPACMNRHGRRRA